MKNKLSLIKNVLLMYSGSLGILLGIIVVIAILSFAFIFIGYYLSPDYIEERSVDYVCFTDKTENSFIYKKKQYNATALQNGWNMQNTTNFILVGHSASATKFSAERLFYYETNSAPTIFYSATDSSDVYYICTEEFEYPVMQTDLPDEIYISCIQDSIELTVTDKTEIENIVNNISTDIKLSEIISSPDICSCQNISIVARWDTFPLEFSLR